VPGYAVLAWTPGHALAEARIALIREALVERSGWRISDNAPGLLVLTDPLRPLAVRRFAWRSGRVIGDLFERDSGRPAGPVLARPAWLDAGQRPLCEHLTRAYWGRYVAVVTSVSGEAGFVFRGPGGGPDCLSWRRDGISVAASDLTDWLLALLPPALSLNLPAITSFLLDPASMGARLGLDGASAALPGAAQDMAGRGAAELIWRPAEFARARNALDAGAARARLAPTIDACIAALASTAGPIVTEVSGGLDSSVVASALTRASEADVRRWINFHVADAEGDERDYARALAAHLDLPLTEIGKPELGLTRESLACLPLAARPSVNGLDRHYDEAMAELCLGLGAQSMFTGQGGDVVFFQGASPLLATDLLRSGAGPGRLNRLLELARWTRRSVWSLLITAGLAQLGPGAARARRWPAFLARHAALIPAAAQPHPWLEGLEGVTPAKQSQIHGLAHAQLAFGECRRGQFADLIHPLLAQPVVELCLATAAIDLTEARRDRAMIRRVFEGRLPGKILGRRSKGDLTAYYGRMLARSLPVLRPWLMDGWLAARRVLALPALDQMLTEDSLIAHGGYPDLMELVAVEAWARAWDSRIRNQASAEPPPQLIVRGAQDV
jgi:asparagine synthase (glutamine-hydrolysing)